MKSALGDTKRRKAVEHEPAGPPKTELARPSVQPGERRVPADAVERATYTVDELAVVLGRNRVGIYADLAANLIPHRRLGKRYIISRTAIHRWLEGVDSHPKKQETAA